MPTEAMETYSLSYRRPEAGFGSLRPADQSPGGDGETVIFASRPDLFLKPQNECIYNVTLLNPFFT